MKHINETKRIQQLAGILNEVEVKATKATDLQFILRDLADAYGEQIGNDLTKDDFKNYTVGQIIDDWKRLKGSIKEAVPAAPASAAPKQTSDVASLTKLIQSNTSLMNKLKTVNSGQEVTETIVFILDNINPKVTGVQKQKLKDLIDQRFK